MRKRTSNRALAAVLFLTAVAIGGIRFYAHTAAQRPTVTAVTLHKTDVKETVVCTGTVSVAEGLPVYAKTPCVAGTVAVSTGDVVKKGDVLLTVDRTATLGLALSTTAAVDTSLLSSVPQTVTAPADGVVSAVSASEGELIDPTTPCVVLSDKQAVEIAVTIREKALPKIKTGQEVTVSGVAFAKKGYRGTVTSIASSARSRVNGSGGETVVDAVVSLYEGEADESLLVGLTAKAAVTVAVHEGVLLVPYACMTQDEEGHAAVYCIDGDTVVRKSVTIGEEYADGAAVSGGLHEGDRVATDPTALEAASVWHVAEGTP